jgi:hypothetical protein
MELMTEQMMERLLAEMRAGHEEMMAEIRTWQKVMMADREAMEACPEEMKSVVEHQEVPKKEAGVDMEMIRTLKEWYGDQHLAIVRCQQLKKQTQGDGGFWKKLANSHRGMTLHAIPASRKGHGRQGPGRNNVMRGAPKGQTLERRQWMHQEGSNGLRGLDLQKQQEGTSGRIFRKTVVGSSTGLREESDWTLWTSNNRLRAMDVGTLTTLRTVALTDW